MSRPLSILLLLVAVIAATLPANSATTSSRVSRLLDGAVSVSEANAAPNGSSLDLMMIINLSALKVRHEETVTLHPYVIPSSSADTIPLDSVIIMGRNVVLRRERLGEIPDPRPAYMLDAGGLKSLLYQVSIPLTPNLTSGNIGIIAVTRRKAGAPLVTYPPVPLLDYTLSIPSFIPRYFYATPARTSHNRRSISRVAAIDFAPGSAAIDPRRMLNDAELDSISAMIARATDSGHTLVSIDIAASTTPGTSAADRSLAAMRTEAIKAFIARRHPSLTEMVTTSVGDDDWEAVDRWVERSSITNRDSILAIIEQHTLPSADRLATLATRFPSETSFLTEVIFPVLNRLTITINTSLPTRDDIADIERTYLRRPSTLSLYELCTYCNYLRERRISSTDDVTLNTAALWPDAPEALINAANVFMSRGLLNDARDMLSRAGSSALADYARGNLEALTGNYARARDYFAASAAKGLDDGGHAIRTLDSLDSF